MNADGFRRACVPGLLVLVVLGVLIASYGYDADARALPVLVGWTTLALLVLEVLVQAGTPIGRSIARVVEGKEIQPEPENVPMASALIHAVAWPGLLVGLTILIGMLPAVLIYVYLSLKMVGGKSLYQALTMAVAVTASSWLLFEWGMSYRLFRGVLMD